MTKNKTEFEKAAAQEKRGGLLSDLWGFLKQNKKWWLLPVIVALLLVAVLIIFAGGSAIAPFIYPLF